MTNNTNSSTILQQANDLIYGARADSYGDFSQFAYRLAQMWEAYVGRRRITPEDIAPMMMLLKTARLAETPTHWDSLLDVAGYVGCAAKLPTVLDPKGNA